MRTNFKMNGNSQVFTPESIAAFMLDTVGYTTDLTDKTFLENACGSGNILRIAVDRYIKDALSRGIGLDCIKQGLEHNIVALDVDEFRCRQCAARLDEVAAFYGLSGIVWNIRQEDYLASSGKASFDYIASNPPYICYRDLDADTRMTLKAEFESCAKGPFDYYYAFVEQGLRQLTENGRMCYIVPNNIWKNVYAARLRSMLLPHLVEVYDYKAKKLFDATTSSTIFLLVRDCGIDAITFRDMETGSESVVSKTDLTRGDKWTFCSRAEEYGTNGSFARFGDYFRATSPIATLLNRAFLIDVSSIAKRESDDGVQESELGESGIVLNATSPRYKGSGASAKIICPYNFGDEVLPIAEEDLKRKHAACYEHLIAFKDDLQARDADKNAQWYEYGRRQGLDTIHLKKLMVSTVVTRCMKVYEVDAGTVVFAGIVIIPRAGNDLGIARRVLESREFLDYVKRIGTNVGGSSIRITARDINEFRFPEDELNG